MKPRFNSRLFDFSTILLALSIGTVHAQSLWTGSTDSVFSTGSNFSPAIATTSASNLDIQFNGSDASTEDLTLAVAFGGSAGGAGSILSVLTAQSNPLTITGSGTAAIRLSSGLTVQAGAGAVTLAGIGNLAIGGLSTASSHSISNLSSNLLNLGSWPVIAGGGNARNLTVEAAGDIVSNGNWSNSVSPLPSSNPLSLTKTGAGKLTLGGANLVTGNTLVSAGVLELTNALALQNSALDTSGAGTVAITGPTTLTIGGLAGTTGLSSVITTGYSGITELTLNPRSGTQTYTGAIANGATGMNLVKSGGGTQVLSGTNSFSGTTSVNGGIFRLGSADALGSTTKLIVSGAGGAIGAAIGNFDFAGISPANAIPLELNSGANNNDIGAFQNSSATAATYSGTVELKRATIVGTGNITLTGGFTGGGFSLNKNGTSTLAITNGGTTSLNELRANRGTIQVNSGTTLNVASIVVGSGNNVSSGLTLNGGSVICSGTSLFGTATTGTASATLTLSAGTFTVVGLSKGSPVGASVQFNTNFNGGVLKASVDNPTFLTGANNARIQAGGALIDDGGFLITIPQPLIHDNALAATPDGGLAKSGLGTLTLSGTNTYTGNTTVNAGTLELAATTGGLTFVPTTNGVSNKITGTGTLALKGIFNIDLTGSTGAAIRLNSSGLSVQTGAGAVTFAGTGTINIGGLGSTTSHAISNQSASLLDFGSWAFIAGGGGTRNLTVEAAGDIVSNGNWSGTMTLAKTGAGTLTLGGTNTHTGATTVSAGVLKLTNASALSTSALDTSGAGTVTVVGPTTLTVGGLTGSTNLASVITTGYSTLTDLTLNPLSGTQTYTGNITNGASGMNVVKSGAGTQVLSGTNTYNGTTSVNGGIFRLGSADALGTTTKVIVSGASGAIGNTIGSLDLAGISPSAATPLELNSGANNNDVGALQNSSGTAVTYSGAVELKRGTILGTGNIAVTGGFTGGGFALNKNGTGTFSITNGGTTSLGTLQANRGTVQVNSGTTLAVSSITVGSGSSVGSGLTLNGGNVTSSGAALFGTATSGTASGTLTLTNGTLTVPSINKGGTAGGSVVFNANFNGGTLKANADSGTFFSGANNAKIQAGGAFIDDGGFAITIAQPLIEDTASTGGSLTKSGLGTLTFTGANQYTGATTINAGTLKAGNAAALGFGGPQKTTTGITTVSSGATLDLNGATLNEPITLSGTGVGGNGALINSSGTPAIIGSGLAGIQLLTGTTGTAYSAVPTITIVGTGTGATATATLGVTAASFTGFAAGDKVYTVAPTVTISGGGGSGATATAVLSGGTTGTLTGFTITNPGSGFTTTPTIAFGAGTFSSGTTNGSATPNATQFTVSGVSMTAAGSGYVGTPTYTFGSGDAVPGSTALSSLVLAADGSAGGSGDITINAVVSESGGARALTKVGAGSLTLSGANTYTGVTTVKAGTLALDSTGSIANSSQIILGATTTFDVSAASGFTVGASNAQSLGGTGSINGNLTVGANGTLAIGNSPGTMTYAGDLTLGLGSISNFEINAFNSGNYDLALAAVAGSQTVKFNGGTLNLLFQSGFNTEGNVKIFDFDAYDGSGFTTVSTTGLASGYTATFNASNGLVTVVPEPNAAVVIVSFGFLALLRRRRAG